MLICFQLCVALKSQSLLIYRAIFFVVRYTVGMLEYISLMVVVLGDWCVFSLFSRLDKEISLVAMLQLKVAILPPSSFLASFNYLLVNATDRSVLWFAFRHSFYPGPVRIASVVATSSRSPSNCASHGFSVIISCASMMFFSLTHMHHVSFSCCRNRSVFLERLGDNFAMYWIAPTID